MDLILAGIIGWCGTWWPRRWPFPPGGGGGNPDDPWPPNCPVCGPLIGAISAVVLWVVLGDEIGGGIAELAIVSFFTGAFGSSLIGGVLSLARGGKRMAGPNG